MSNNKSKINWTDSQYDAIHSSGNNILVSAGAGSGKTTVLTERLYEKIKKGTDVRRLLVLTFTNAAANSMREKIRKKLIEEKMEYVLNDLDSAYITTFDAFSLAMVKKYAYKLGIEKDVKISDSILIKMDKRKRIEDKFRLLYEQNNVKFLEFLKKYTEKDDKEIINLILDFTYKLDLIDDVDNYVANFEEKFFQDEYLENLANEYEKIILIEISELKDQVSELINLLDGDTPNLNLFNQYTSFLDELNFSNTYEKLKVALSAKFGKVAAKVTSEEIIENKKAIASLIKEIDTKYFKYETKKSMIEYIKKTHNDAIFLIMFAKEINDELFEYKKEKAYFDFIDIAKLVNILISDFEEVRNEIKNSFDEIMIDEYQDTSDIQDAFIFKISNNNVYMVGDIKQSIYRFRNANPVLFKNKFDTYDGNLGIKICLNENFRSRQEVINDINFIFNYSMTEEFGETNYIKNHQMKFGNLNYQTKGKIDCNSNLEILKYTKTKDFEPAEIEAFTIAKDILSKINNNYKVFDKEIRDANYNDFCILIDRATSFPIFKKVFEYFKIPLAIISESDLKEGSISLILLNILKGIASTSKKDITYRHAVVSVLRSFVFSKTDEYILVNQNADNEATVIFRELHSSIDKISASDLYFLALKKFGIYEKIMMIGDTKNSMVQIEYFYNLIKGLSDLGKTFEEIVLHLSNVFDDDFNIKYNVIENISNKVRIMTIHKSKGLEFPICYYPMTSTLFNQQDFKINKGFNQKYGVFLPAYDDGYVNTIINQLIVNDLKNKDISEKIRLLYVALTRAKEKIIIISQNTDKIKPSKKFSSFSDIINSIPQVNKYSKQIDIEKLELTKSYKNKQKDLNLDVYNLVSLKYNNNVYYGNPIYKKQISQTIEEIMDINLRNKIELGLKFHNALEVLDFKTLDIDILNTNDYIKEIIKDIFKNPIFKNIKNAKTYHEHEFYFNYKNEEYHGIIDLFVEYDTYIDIIDYKLSDTSKKEYSNQLNIYRKYIMSKTNKQVNMYLLSILKKDLKKVEENEIL